MKPARIFIPACGDLHGRAVEEWVGRTPDTPVPPHVALRVLLRQERKCALTGVKIRPGEKSQCDHIKRLKDGGENRETNLQVIRVKAHAEKTAAENTGGAKVASLQLKAYGLKPKSKHKWPKRRFGT